MSVAPSGLGLIAAPASLLPQYSCLVSNVDLCTEIEKSTPIESAFAACRIVPWQSSFVELRSSVQSVIRPARYNILSQLCIGRLAVIKDMLSAVGNRLSARP